MKPRILFCPELNEWTCFIAVYSDGQDPSGFGTTPQEAYADWKRKTDSLSRIDAD